MQNHKTFKVTRQNFKELELDDFTFFRDLELEYYDKTSENTREILIEKYKEFTFKNTFFRDNSEPFKITITLY
jgi:hypothetical protein